MVIVSFYGRSGFLETYIVEAGKRRAANVAYRVIGYQEMFLPPHEYVVGVFQFSIVKRVGIERLSILTECGEFVLVKQTTVSVQRKK